jgi:pimeloyl-ACP methyl ester carboxylesterase
MDVDLPDGRVLETMTLGPAGGSPVVLFSGTPSAPVAWPALEAAAAEAGWHVITWARPGYGRSTPLAGRSVADVARDLPVVLDAFGIAEFVTLGMSGGGPHALACAALAGGRCRAAATVGSVAPHDAVGLDWLAGMAAENHEEFGAAVAGEAELTRYLAEAARGLAVLTREDMITALGGLVDEPDKRAAAGPLGEWLHASLVASVASGIDGWLDDDLAFIRPWGFEVADIRIPVTIWQGGEDRMVPYSHGQWLAAHIPGATARLLPEHGHLSLLADGLRQVLGELVA